MPIRINRKDVPMLCIIISPVMILVGVFANGAPWWMVLIGIGMLIAGVYFVKNPDKWDNSA